MPIANPPSPPVPPAPLTQEEAGFIKRTVEHFYGNDAIVRNFGPDPKRLFLHVETDKATGVEFYDCVGVLMTRIARDQIDLTVTTRGRRIRGFARLAYRQGVIL
jgi:hypothetical protein